MLWTIPALVAIAIASLGAHGGSLAQAAFFESVRRALTPAAAQSLTMAGAPQAAVSAAVEEPAAAPPTPPPPAAGAADATPPAVGLERSAEKDAADEKAWRARMDAAREALDRDQVLLDAMQSRINALTTDVIARDDPAQKALLEKQRLRALDELKRLTAQVAGDQKAIADVEEDARKQGIPPGWIR